MRAAVTETNARVTELARVLNAPTVEGLVRVDAPVRHLTKLYGQALYIIAGADARSGLSGPSATFRLPCAGDDEVTVLYEDRVLRMIDGVFTDAFADGNTVHLYLIDDPSGCQLPGAGLRGG